jgi:hypothetical protein
MSCTSCGALASIIAVELVLVDNSRFDHLVDAAVVDGAHLQTCHSFSVCQVVTSPSHYAFHSLGQFSFFDGRASGHFLHLCDFAIPLCRRAEPWRWISTQGTSFEPRHVQMMPPAGPAATRCPTLIALLVNIAEAPLTLPCIAANVGIVRQAHAAKVIPIIALVALHHLCVFILFTNAVLRVQRHHNRTLMEQDHTPQLSQSAAGLFERPQSQNFVWLWHRRILDSLDRGERCQTTSDRLTSIMSSSGLFKSASSNSTA